MNDVAPSSVIASDRTEREGEDDTFSGGIGAKKLRTTVQRMQVNVAWSSGDSSSCIPSSQVEVDVVVWNIIARNSREVNF